jgi:hypothetical protein
MITRLLGLTLTLLALLAVMAHAEEPTGFRDVPFGATEAEVKAKFPEAFCNARSEATSCVVKDCRGSSDGDVHVDASIK